MSVPAGVLTVDANATLKDEYGRDAVLTHGAFGPFAGKPGQHAAARRRRITGMELDVGPARQRGASTTSGDDIDRAT